MNIKSWLKYHLPFTEVWNEYYNPWYVWWKCRKYFNFPYIHFYHGHAIWRFGMPSTYNRFIDFRTQAVGWKRKYERLEHEWDPYIAITFFRKWQLMWTFNYVSKDKDSWVRNMATWEAMLDMAFDGRSLVYVVNNHQWSDDIDIIPNLTWEGVLKYKQDNENMCNK